jgi:hypothetical protein
LKHIFAISSVFSTFVPNKQIINKKAMKTRNMISFDWAMKRLLRNKANFEILEGFLSELLRRKIVINHIGESEGNKESEDDKYNRVDILVEADGRELVIVELQYLGQDDYFQRMLYGVSKAVTEHIGKGAPYSEVRKAYSVNIVNFDLGAGDDYVYHGFTNFTGLHTRTELELNAKQRRLYGKTCPGDLYPEYYIIKTGKFDEAAKDTLDEWIFYLKTGKIRDDFTAKGIDRAREVLAYDNLTDSEKKQYDRMIKDRRIRDSEIVTAFTDGAFKGEIKGLKKGEAERKRLEAERKRLEAERERLETERERLETEKEAAQKLARQQAQRIAELEKSVSGGK